jgi:hypothetical protein
MVNGLRAIQQADTCKVQPGDCSNITDAPSCLDALHAGDHACLFG